MLRLCRGWGRRCARRRRLVSSTAPEADAGRFDVNTVSLRFLDSRSERGFRHSRKAALVASMTVACAGLGAFTLVLVLLTELVGSKTCNGTFIETPQTRRICSARRWLHISETALMVSSVAAMRLRALARRIGTGGLEATAGAVIVLSVAGVIFQHPMYMAVLFGVQDPSQLFAGDAGRSDWELLLYVDAIVMGIHLVVPLRWSLLWAVNVAIFAMVVFAILALSNASLGSTLIMLAVFSLLCAMAAFGKREREIFERMHYASVVLERTLRARAEFKLHASSSSEAPADAKRAADVRSVVTSALTRDTGEVFCMRTVIGAGQAEDRLERIVQLGRREHWLIGPEEVQVLPKRILGVGGFGLVVQGTLYGADVAIKVSRVSHSQEPEKLSSTVEELRIYRRLKHPNIVPFLGAGILPETLEIFIVLGLVQGETLRKMGPSFPAESAADIARRSCWVDDICCALAFLHAQDPTIVHGDIKASNVIVAPGGDRTRAMLLDFGLSRLLTPGAPRLGGTLQWKAPEVALNRRGSVSPAADVFSFGRLVYMIMSGRPPLQKATRDQIIESALRGQCVPLEWPSEMARLDEIQAMVVACTDMEPKRRPSIVQAQRTWRKLHPAVWPEGGEDDVAKDLRSALEEVRNVDFSALQPTEGSRSRSAGAAGSGRLVHSCFKQTPDPSCVVSLLRAIQRWNVPVTTADCCTLHAVVRKAAELSASLGASRCNHHIPEVDSQCPKCLVVIEGNLDVCPVCRGECPRVGGGAAASPNPRGQSPMRMFL